MKLRFLEPAQREVDDAVRWYDRQADGLAQKFLDDPDRTIRRIISFPESCSTIEQDLRRCLLSRFPFGVIYGIDDQTVVVVAVAHSHREPEYWIERRNDF